MPRDEWSLNVASRRRGGTVSFYQVLPTLHILLFFFLFSFFFSLSFFFFPFAYLLLVLFDSIVFVTEEIMIKKKIFKLIGEVRDESR